MSTLLQDVKQFHEKAMFYNLSRLEISSTVAAWQQEHGEVAAQAVMSTVDPSGEIFGFPAKSGDILKARLVLLFEQAKLYDLTPEEVQDKLVELVVDGHVADEIRDMLPVVDPGRLVFTYPIQPGDKGVHGLDLWANRYDNFSDTCGHHLIHSEHISSAFVEVCEQLWQEGVLYDHGGLSVDKATLQGGYAIVVALEAHVKPDTKDLELLNIKHGMDFECLSMVLKHDPKAFGADVVMTTLITDSSKLMLVPEIAQSMQDVADRWAQHQLKVVDNSPSP
ncbi:hypothetical protein RBE51_22385 [Pseudomonas taiwanensis]|uniref:hypothetical protein n=1 Tax=Pseudomonas taiwanensis TaxID=470150 RepID=UPI0028DDC995|nr:hypothetical protein [Pseudomonas taiwanensis]MDT8925534.1 hypothetical protein [Pseudomonas taiwanensis]